MVNERAQDTCGKKGIKICAVIYSSRLEYKASNNRIYSWFPSRLPLKIAVIADYLSGKSLNVVSSLLTDMTIFLNSGYKGT